MIDVGILAQEARAGALANVSPIFGCTCICEMPRELVLDRILDGEDVEVRLVDLVQARVERGRLAGAGRAGDEDDAVGPRDQVLHQCVVARG